MHRARSLALRYLAMICVSLAACGPGSQDGMEPLPGPEGDGLAPPLIHAVTPASGPMDGGIGVVIDGENFASGARVYFGAAVASSVAVLSSNRLFVALPKSAKQFGAVPVVVRNRDDQQAERGELFYYYGSHVELVGQGLGGVLSEDRCWKNLSSLVSGDWNSDGITDLAVGSTLYQVSFYFGDGHGGFLEAKTVNLKSTSADGKQFLAPADWNGDGKLDLAVLGEAGGLVTLLGDGLGNFAWVTGRNLGYWTYVSAAAADLDGDGKPDLIGGTAHGLVVGFGLGNGDFASGLSVNLPGGTSTRVMSPRTLPEVGMLQQVLAINSGGSQLFSVSFDSSRSRSRVSSVDGGSNTESMAWGDFDHDGVNDVAVANLSGVRFLSGHGLAPMGEALISEGVVQLVSGDFNQDQKADLAVISPGGSACTSGVSPCYSVTTLLQTQAWTFARGSSFAVGPSPEAIVAGDWDRDGQLDLAIGNRDSANLSLHLGDGHGNFTALLFLPVSSAPRSVLAADLNSDALADIVASTVDGKISTYLSDGNGGYTAPQSTAAISLLRAVAIGELNGDGFADLITFQGTSLHLHPGLGNGRFGPSIPVATGLPDAWGANIETADFNSDGLSDLIVWPYMGATDTPTAIYLADGAGGLAAPTWYMSRNQLQIGDWDGDKHLDLATPECGTVRILSGDGQGHFSETKVLTGVPSCSALVFDFNQDGNLDLVTWEGSYFGSGFYRNIYFNDGHGGFVQKWRFYDAFGAVRMTDWNGDGRPDLAIGAIGKLRIMKSEPNGELSIATAVGTWPGEPSQYSGSFAIGDFNGDGRPDVVMGGFNYSMTMLAVSLNRSH